MIVLQSLPCLGYCFVAACRRGECTTWKPRTLASPHSRRLIPISGNGPVRQILIDTNAYAAFMRGTIAACALEHGLAQLTLDAHFDKVKGLRAGASIACFLP